MASVALDGTPLGTAEGLTRPGTWRVSPRNIHVGLTVALMIPPRFARP